MSALMVHQNHSLLARHIPYLPKAFHVPIAGVQRPPHVKVTPQIGPFLHGKKIWAQVFQGDCRGGSKAPRHWKTKPIWPPFLAPHGFNPKYFNPPLGFHGWAEGPVQGWEGREGSCRAAAALQIQCRASALRLFSGQGTSQLTGSQLGWHRCCHSGNHRSQNHKNPQMTESQEPLSWEALSGIIQSKPCPAQTP